MLFGNRTRILRVEEGKDVANSMLLVLLGGFETGAGIRVEAIEEANFAGIPMAVRVEVVEGKERNRVKVPDMMFFYRTS